jgi:hypothetical protein
LHHVKWRLMRPVRPINVRIPLSDTSLHWCKLRLVRAVRPASVSNLASDTL